MHEIEDVARATESRAAPTERTRRRSRKAPSCEDCFFRRRGLCALDLGPCATFRPERPEGLMPPRQPVLLVREPAPEEAPDRPAAGSAAEASPSGAFQPALDLALAP